MSQQRGYGLGGVFRSAGRYVNPILEEVGKITATVGADLAKNLLTDVIEGKDVKESARERGKEAGKQSLNLGTKRVIEKVQGQKAPPKTTPKAAPKAVKRPRSQSVGPKKKKPRKSQKGGKRKKGVLSQKGGFTQWLMEEVARDVAQRGGAKSGSKKNSQKRAVGVVFPRAMTSKQRRSLPPKDIFG